ncbi:MAG: Diacylglycerol kinase family protein [Rhodospirillales bacterium]|nr:Diacylglycerol kinase family protein [Rhodospirillales bacterium]
MAGKPERALLIVNQKSRSGATTCNAVEEALSRSGLTVEKRDCERPEDLPQLIRDVRDICDCVVMGGGDGTLNAALPGILDTGLPLGIIPMGTANDLARTLAIPEDLDEAANVVATGHRRRIDIGEVNGKPFFNVASVGFGVDLTRALTRDAKRRWGVFGYIAAGLRVLHRVRPFHVTVTIGDTVHRSRTLHLSVGNGRHYGGGMTVSEDAAIDDNRLDVYSLEASGVIAALKLLPSLRAGTQGRWSEVKTLAGQEVLVETTHPRSVNADGEIVTQTPAHFRVLAGAMEVFAPPNPSAETGPVAPRSP